MEKRNYGWWIIGVLSILSIGMVIGAVLMAIFAPDGPYNVSLILGERYGQAVIAFSIIPIVVVAVIRLGAKQKATPLIFKGLMIIGALACGALAVFLAGRFKVNTSSEAAAWMQVVGAIAALGVTVYISNSEKMQRHKERNEELHKSTCSLIKSINSVQRIAVQFYNLRARNLNKDKDKTDYDDLFRAWSNAFTEVYLHQQRWIDLGLIISVMEVSLQLKKMLEINRSVLDGNLDNLEVSNEMKHVFPFLFRAKAQIVSFAIEEGLLKKDDKLIQDIEGLTEVKAHLDEAQFEKNRQNAQKALEAGSLSGNAG